MQKKVLIIGGTSGLGRKLAELYIEKGHLVAVVGRRQHLLNQLKSQFKEKVITYQADISSLHPVFAIKEITNLLGGLDIFILTAGFVEFNEPLSWEIEEATIKTNVTGFAKAVNEAYHFFLEQDSGHIVITTSTASSRGNKLAPAYNASKVFQSFYAEGIRIKLKGMKSNVRVTELVPGYMDTDMMKGERLFWIAPVEKAARQCIKAIEKKKAKAFITKRWWLIYHLQRLMPAFIYEPVINGSWKLRRSKQSNFK